MASEKPSSKGQAWFCTTGLPSDVIMEVDDMTFHLHKFPLMSKSKKLHELITEQEKNTAATRSTNIQNTHLKENDNDSEEKEIQEEEEGEEDECHITLPDFPGGSDAFETAAKFCYGVKIDLSASNVAPLRCAGEYLEMTEEYAEDNLISKTERFFTQSILKNMKHSVKTLISCEKLLPLAENLGIVQRCIDSIANRAASSDPSLFGWPVTVAEGKGGAEANARRKGNHAAKGGNGVDCWLDELGHLSLPLFKRLIYTMRTLNLNGEIIESCLIFYAKKFIPGISRSTLRKPSSSSNMPSENEQKELLETVIANLPLEKSIRSASSSTRILFGLLRTANILNASEACRAALEKKIGSQLEQATLDDMLIPSYSYLNETLYDVDCVKRILEYFLEILETNIRNEDENENSSSVRSTSLMLVGKLIDGYLSEIASDANLNWQKFYDLTIALPDHARLYDDGLYRAVDVYLKAHPWISESEREKICGVLDCQKLTLEACTHAAQNERLPLRAVVQVLFFEQVQLRQAIAGSLLTADMLPSEAERLDEGGDDDDGDADDARAANEGSGWRSAVRENQVLRLDMDSMRTRVQELERECSTMREVISKIDKKAPRRHVEKDGWRNSLTRKFGCKFKTQVCDSHERTATVVEAAKKGRNHRHAHAQWSQI